MRRLLVLVLLLGAAAVGLIAAGNLGYGPVVITREGEQKLILFFGDVRTVTEPGLAFRLPLVEETLSYDRRWQFLGTEELPIQTRDGEQLNVDNYVIWRIEDPVEFKRAFPGSAAEAVKQAKERIDRAVRDDVREVIGRHALVEVLKDARASVMEEITGATRDSLAAFGIGVGDVRINRTELPEKTLDNVYARMKSERERLARRNRAEGEEKARVIRAEADREARVTVANARRDAEVARGTGDAEATRIYAEAHQIDPEFFAFVRSLEAYRKAIDEHTTLVLSPEAEFFRFLEGAGVPAPPTAE
jgi:membrane protease subunit HflC